LPCKPQTCRAFLCTRRRACSCGAVFVLAFNVIAALFGISAGLVFSLRLRLKLPKPLYDALFFGWFFPLGIFLLCRLPLPCGEVTVVLLHKSGSLVAKLLEKNGLVRMSTETERISFNIGYTKEGFADKVYHIHLRYTGDNDELFFRDYLNEHPGVAKEYEALKLKLWKKYEHNRDGYTDAKTDFIHKWTSEARKLYGNRF